jgi:hypothetical protein
VFLEVVEDIVEWCGVEELEVLIDGVDVDDVVIDLDGFDVLEGEGLCLFAGDEE